MSDYGTLESRVRRKSLLSKVMKPEDTIQFFNPGQNLVWSGFTPAGSNRSPVYEQNARST